MEEAPDNQVRSREDAPGGLRRAGDIEGCKWSLDEAGKRLCSACHPRKRRQVDWLRGEAGPRWDRWDQGPQPRRPRTPTSSSSRQMPMAWPFPFSMVAVWFVLLCGPQWPGHHLCVLNEPFGQRSACPGLARRQAVRTGHQTATGKPFLLRASVPFLESANLTIEAQEKRGSVFTCR